ncbi:SHOCT domain-containing protein [Candidatus Daviesbacteria bacterium]|nr:SHOCT domain-containing protein [Candidatus Daviesbacteria bacterium]
MMGYDSWGGFGFGWIFMIIFWILIILGVVALVRYLGNSGKTIRNDKTPLEILQERYAKGEIDKKEFEEKKKDLA